MSVVPCEKNSDLRRLIDEYAEDLRRSAHTIGNHGLSEEEFYASGLFRGAVERLRGQFSASMAPKRGFVSAILNHLQDLGSIQDWVSAGAENRHDYSVTLNDGRTAVIELKGCLDGNNTNIFERPPHADEFVVWSVCTNEGADPQHNIWSGLHTRLSAEVVSRGQRVDGVVVWDWLCGTMGRPCPKITLDPERVSEIGRYRLPPPCIYLFASTVPSPRNNPSPQPQRIQNVGFLASLHRAFNGRDEELHEVQITVGHAGVETVRTTEVRRGGEIVKRSGQTPIRRS
ncbi:MAG: hypothetical protein ACK4L4_07655 [Gemmobacter sp.]